MNKPSQADNRMLVSTPTMPGWRLLTGDPEQVNRVLHAMRQSDTDIAQHDAFLWVGDPHTKAWTRISSLAAPETIATLIRRMEDE